MTIASEEGRKGLLPTVSNLSDVATVDQSHCYTFVSMLRESLYLLSPALYTITDDEFKEE